MNIIRTLKTPIFEVSLLDNELLYIDYTISVLDDLEVMKEQAQLIEKEFDLEEFYMISNIKRLKRVSKEVRSFSANPDAMKKSKALAMITGNGMSRIVGNFYLKMVAPVIPTKIFTNFEKAQAWILDKRVRNQKVE